MTVSKYKAIHCIIPLLRSKGVTQEEVQSEVEYRKAHIKEGDIQDNPNLKFITLNELIEAERNWELAD